MTAVLEVSSIKKSFGGIKAVDGVSFDVQEGEILGLIGPNGCGKSTLFNCILGQLTPTGGEVKVDGKGRIVWPKEIASDAVLPFPKGHAYAP